MLADYVIYIRHCERYINNTNVKDKPFIGNVLGPYLRSRKKGLESKFRKRKAIGAGPVAVRLKYVCIKQILWVKIFVFYREKLQEQWSLYVPPGLTLSNSTFFPHSVFMCFVWISEQTAIISLHNINWLVFITETECVYCAVRTECLHVIRVNLVCRQ
jgi:hypothetical protein